MEIVSGCCSCGCLEGAVDVAGDPHSDPPPSVFIIFFLFNCLLFIMILSISLRSYFTIALRENENSLKLKWKRYCPEFYYAPILPSAGKIDQYLENESNEQ